MDSITFTEQILNRELHFLCNERKKKGQYDREQYKNLPEDRNKGWSSIAKIIIING